MSYISLMCFFVPSLTGSPLVLTADGSVTEALLVNMIPGKTYQVTVSALKGLEESDPSTDSITTGWICSAFTQLRCKLGNESKVIDFELFLLVVLKLWTALGV